MKDETRCPACGETLYREWENLGYDSPDPDRQEVVRVYCPVCGYEEN